MKVFSRILILLALGTLLVIPTSGVAQKSKQSEKTLIGYISDNHCGLKHKSGMGDDKSCTLTCVKNGGSFVLADRDHKRVYKLDEAGQEKAREFAGQRVKVTGSISGKTIRVTGIEAAT